MKDFDLSVDLVTTIDWDVALNMAVVSLGVGFTKHFDDVLVVITLFSEDDVTDFVTMITSL